MMSKDVKLSTTNKIVRGEITLDGSKSISNRVLIIKALCEQDFKIHNLSTSDDTQTLVKLLSSEAEILDAHHAGTTFRFMTSFLATKEGKKSLTGSDRMLERPIAPLVNALKELGATITYVRKEGYPPIEIQGNNKIRGGKISIDAGISSQFISALLLIAPTLENGLELELVGDMVSRPYLEMTLGIMEHFGISHTWVDNAIYVKPQKYRGNDFFVEADWSAASYYYSLAALSLSTNITLYGLTENSLQGDKAIAEIGNSFGITTTFYSDHIEIKKDSSSNFPQYFEYNFLLCPDIAQTVSVMCAGLGVQSLFTGLKTLFIKETDRVAALKTELQKTGVFLTKLPEKFSRKSGTTYFMQEGVARSDDTPRFNTFNDHRMAMSFAPLALCNPIIIEDKGVVSKSYPRFWEDISSVTPGLRIEQI